MHTRHCGPHAAFEYLAHIASILQILETVHVSHAYTSGPPKRVRVTFPPPYMQYRDRVGMLECMVEFQRKRLPTLVYIYVEVGHGVCGYNTYSMSRTCICRCVVFVLHSSLAHVWQPCRCMMCGARASFYNRMAAPTVRMLGVCVCACVWPSVVGVQ